MYLGGCPALDHWQFRWQVVLPNGELLCHGRLGEVEVNSSLGEDANLTGFFSRSSTRHSELLNLRHLAVFNSCRKGDVSSQVLFVLPKKIP